MYWDYLLCAQYNRSGKNKLKCAFVRIRWIFSGAWFNVYLTCANSTCTELQLYYARSAWMLSNLDNPRGTDSHIIGHAFSEPAGLIRDMGLSDACAKSIESTDSVPANCAMRNRRGRNEVVVAGMPAARAWLVGRNAARGAHGWNRLPGSSATVWSRRAVLSRAGGYVQKFRTLPGFLWDPGSARQASCGGFRRSWAESSALKGLPAAHCDGCDRGQQFVRHSRAPASAFTNSLVSAEISRWICRSAHP